MALLLLTATASALTAGASAFVQVAAAAAATAAGSFIDNRLFGGGAIRQEGPRLDNLQVQASTEGAPIPEMAGRVRLAGQIIWATRFKETASTRRQGGKGARGGVTTTTYSYSVSFAVAFCEGQIDRIGRIWADGKPMNLSGVIYRVHRGTPTQPPDPLIEGIEGAGSTPAYRGTAYVVFENLGLEAFGNRIPQLNFEVFRRVNINGSDAIEEALRAITMIPGSGERAYDTTVQTRDLGEGRTMPENDAFGVGVSDWNRALDDLKAALPNVQTIFLVVGWFGDDLRCGACTVRPKCENREKVILPDGWQVHGLDRTTAMLVTTVDDRPAYGGTPSDDTVVRSVRDLKARGYAVVFYPFLFMDIAAGNNLPNPYSANAAAVGQPPHPWRGRITCSPAPGFAGSVDKTATAASQVAAFFGDCLATHIAVSINPTSAAVTTSYSGPAEWGFRRFILHYARLCAALNSLEPGAIDAFLIGTEMRGLCAIRDSASSFPAVARFVTLAADVKGIVGAAVKVSYAADWSDYSNFRPNDGSNDVFFHLDPLWASPHVDFIGIDWYAPLSDWRDGLSHLDRITSNVPSIYHQPYLRANVAGGELFDWFYASDADRQAQIRTPISDGAHGKPWVFRIKDVRNWWLNPHINRPGGTESGSPTAWVPQSKPIWFCEWGVPSIDKGSNQPNVFYDPKSSESFFPFFSKGSRDDLIQRAALEALIAYWKPAAGHNPTSALYGGPMIEVISAWTWDSRPYPAWPGRQDLWSDGVLYPLGHWLQGKVGLGDLAALVAERCQRVGFQAYDVSRLNGVVVGYFRDRPMSPRVEIEALMAAYAFDAVETDGVIRFIHRGSAPVITLTRSDLARPEQGEELTLTRGQESELPHELAVSFTDALDTYQAGAVAAKRLAGWSDRRSEARFPLVMDQVQAQGIADRLIVDAWIERETAQFSLPPAQIALDPGDVLALAVDGQARAFRITRILDRGARACEAVRTEGTNYAPSLGGVALPTVRPPPVFGAVTLRLMDLPLLQDSDGGHSPYATATASPWRGAVILDSATGTDFALDRELPFQATMGETLAPLASGPSTSWDRGNLLEVKLYAGELTAMPLDALLSGMGNALALGTPDGAWEIVQFAVAELIGERRYRLTTLLCGRLGTEHAIRASLPAGAPIVLLNAAVDAIDGRISERGATRFYRYGPPGLSLSDPAWQQLTFTTRAAGLMPWSPVHLSGGRTVHGDLSMAWVRRTRFGGVWADGVDVPLNEESERYEVDILNGSTVLRTLATATPQATYTASQQTTDFGAPQPAIAVRAVQLSATVGRGHATDAIL
jgi:hypothetical protein